MLFRTVVFLLLNFGALALGSIFTSSGVSSDWYQELNKAPWTPPGWVFGAAWTLIMVLFSVYMAELWGKVADKKALVVLYTAQWILNVAWNPLFFHLKYVLTALVAISLLTVLVFYFLRNFRRELGILSMLILPYAIWLIIATSLNAYILFYN